MLCVFFFFFLPLSFEFLFVGWQVFPILDSLVTRVAVE